METAPFAAWKSVPWCSGTAAPARASPAGGKHRTSARLKHGEGEHRSYPASLAQVAHSVRGSGRGSAGQNCRPAGKLRQYLKAPGTRHRPLGSGRRGPPTAETPRLRAAPRVPRRPVSQSLPLLKATTSRADTSRGRADVGRQARRALPGAQRCSMGWPLRAPSHREPGSTSHQRRWHCSLPVTSDG